MVEGAGRPRLSIIIPVLNDTAALATLLPTLDGDSTLEIIVVDGGQTREEDGEPSSSTLATRHPAVVWMRSARGRGAQMNCGARRARGEWLIFLHADTRLGPGWRQVFPPLDANARIVGGSFRFVLDSTSAWARWIERGVRLRVRLFDLAYGDQALFARRTAFETMGGYKDMPLMEDVDFIRRLRRLGRLEHAAIPAITSARRWERDGWIRRSVENVALVLLFFAGRSPEALARQYQRRTH